MNGVVPFDLQYGSENTLSAGGQQLTLSDWDISCYDCGNPERCYTCFCPSCALAQARTNVDGSDFCFNFFCLFPPVTLWLIHSAYGIPCTANHILEIMCFGNCYINRVYQTTANRGNPNANFRGKHKNTVPLNDPCCPTCACSSCLFAAACPCCFFWYKLYEHMNMPCCIACCTCPWTAQNLLRYQYGIGGGVNVVHILL